MRTMPAIPAMIAALTDTDRRVALLARGGAVEISGATVAMAGWVPEVSPAPAVE